MRMLMSALSQILAGTKQVNCAGSIFGLGSHTFRPLGMLYRIEPVGTSCTEPDRRRTDTVRSVQTVYWRRREENGGKVRKRERRGREVGAVGGWRWPAWPSEGRDSIRGLSIRPIGL